MDRPFREVHELYKILYERAQAQQKAEEERKQKEEEEARKQAQQKRGPSGFSPSYNRQPPTDAIPNISTITEPSPFEAEALEDALEEFM